MSAIAASSRAPFSAALLSTLLLTFGAVHTTASAGESVLQTLKPLTDDMLANPAPADWLIGGETIAHGVIVRSINWSDNVDRLRLAWAWNMEPGYQEEAPLAHDGIVYLANPKNVVQALDGRTGDLLWEYRRELPKIEGSYHDDFIDRARGTIALYTDKVFLTLQMPTCLRLTLDGQSDLGRGSRRLSSRLHVYRRPVGRRWQGCRRHFGLHQPRNRRRVFYRGPQP